jgi:ribosomal protein S18 acetylase RimI-like enzyme
MHNDLIKYESSKGVDVNYKKFSILITDEVDNPLGGLNAYTAYAEVYVDGLWVDSSHRGKGYGRKLIQELYNHFNGKGFNNINLVTSAFQAPEFYKKCGFLVEYVRTNIKNPQFTKTFFIRYFEDESQTQGVIC